MKILVALLSIMLIAGCSSTPSSQPERAEKKAGVEQITSLEYKIVDRYVDTRGPGSGIHYTVQTSDKITKTAGEPVVLELANRNKGKHDSVSVAFRDEKRREILFAQTALNKRGEEYTPVPQGQVWWLEM